VASRPLLLLTIDVEEDMPDWRITDPITTRNVGALPRLDAMCRELGVRPTYLCSFPVVAQVGAVAVRRTLHAGGDWLVSAHLHPWNTPPFDGIPGRDVDERSTAYYLSALGPERFRAKLAKLRDAIGELTGRAPVSFRAGRFGIDGPTLAELPPLGFTVDSSVTPHIDHSAEDDGPDFRGAPETPYRPSRDDVSRRGDLPIVEIPVSISLTRRLPAGLRALYFRIPPKTRVRGLLSRDYLGVLDLTWLYPARHALPLMSRAARVLRDGGVPFLNVFLHSSELVAGLSKDVRTEADVDGVFARMRGIFEVALRELDAVPATLDEAGRALAPLCELRA